MPFQESDFKHGAIIRINLRDFLTFTEVEVCPGAYLNLIIGANGTGKSTLLCAICIGLAGKPSILGRADNLHEFIKHGAHRAIIIIELYNSSGDNWIIQREITQQQSSWQLNGQTSTTKKVEILVKGLNIQMNNLCQFLPQDKVAHFSKMTHQQLLISTENAIDMQIYKQHSDLIENSQSVGKQNIMTKKLEKSLEHEREAYDRIKVYEETFKQREVFIIRVKHLRKLKFNMIFENKCVLLSDLKSEMEQMMHDINERRKNVAPKEKVIKNNGVKVAQFQSKCTAQVNIYNQTYEQFKNKITSMNNFSSQIDDIQNEMANQKEEVIKEQKKLEQLQQIIEDMKTEIDNLPEMQDYTEDIQCLKVDMTKVTSDLNDNKLAFNDCNDRVVQLDGRLCGERRQLEEIATVHHQRLNLLKGKDLNAYKAYNWYQNNKDIFSAEVHGPIMLAINVTDKQFCKVIEGTIAYRDMKAFVFENSKDMTLFGCKMEEKGINVNLVIAPTRPVAEFSPQIPIQRLKRYGFKSYLRELFTCSDTIMRFLCSNNMVHSIPVGDVEIEKNLDSLKTQFPTLVKFFSPNFSYVIKRSKYGSKESIMRTSQLGASNLLSVAVDEEKRIQITSNIKNITLELNQFKSDMEQIQEICDQYSNELNSLRQKRKDFESERLKRSYHITKLKNKEQALKRYRSEMINFDQLESQTAEKMKKLLQNKMNMMTLIPPQLKSLAESSQNNMIYNMRLDHLKGVNTLLKTDILEVNRVMHELEKHFFRKEESYKEMKAEVKILKRKLKDNNYNESELVQVYDGDLPTNLSDLEDVIIDLQARADCALDIDEDVIHEVEERRQKIEKLEAELVSLEALCEQYNTNLEQLHNAWINPIKELLEKINSSFSEFFISMGNKGEVYLKVPSDQHDYENYGVAINVRFRSTDPMQELTSHRQSGGERSVCTVLYMMALQRISSCPFRCVDEINQGMDPSNERKIFDLISECSGNIELGSQYFLLTPKLLPNLNYTRTTNIIMVYNGSGLMIKDHQFKISKLMALHCKKDSAKVTVKCEGQSMKSKRRKVRA